jgi:tripartite-type tricarboxylate transporter receptor subunit TctC
MLRHLFFTLLLSPILGHPLWAAEVDDWPSAPVKFIVPFAPGGATDLIGRIVAQKLSETFKQQFIVENRPGAGASLGSNLVAKATPNGYTLLLTNSGSHAAAPGLFKNLPYDPVSDFTHVALVATTPTVLVANAKFPVQTLNELVSYAKANPGKLNFATSGNGSSAHLVGELFMLEAQIRMVHVPYRGAGPAMLDVLANQVPMMFDSLGSSSARIRSGDVRALAVSAARRLKGFPNVPTFIERGLPNVVSTSWFGVSGPRGLPPAIQEKLAGALTRILQAADLQARFAELEFEPATLPPEEFSRFIQGEADRWGKVIRQAGIKLE